MKEHVHTKRFCIHQPLVRLGWSIVNSDLAGGLWSRKEQKKPESSPLCLLIVETRPVRAHRVLGTPPIAVILDEVLGFLYSTNVAQGSRKRRCHIDPYEISLIKASGDTWEPPHSGKNLAILLENNMVQNYCWEFNFILFLFEIPSSRACICFVLCNLHLVSPKTYILCNRKLALEQRVCIVLCHFITCRLV